MQIYKEIVCLTCYKPIILQYFISKTNEAKQGLMRTPVSKSLNILYFILTFTSENLFTH